MSESKAVLDLLASTKQGETLIIVGAGISMEEPAAAPSPAQVIAGALKPIINMPTLKTVIATDKRINSIFEHPLHQILPESFYAGIETSLGVSLHREVWEPLTTTGISDGIFNMNHELVALIAYKLSATIITPNYDSFLEAAFKAWEIPYELIHNDSLETLSRPKPNGHVRLIKIHGDAAKPETIVSRAPDLLRLFQALAPLNECFSIALIAGYSGRDLDIYPWLAAHSGVRKTIWLDPYLNNDHRCYRLPKELGLIALKEKLDLITNLVPKSRHESKVPTFDKIKSTGQLCADIAQSKMREVLATNEPAKAHLALATVLTNVGFHASSYEILKTARTETDHLLHSQIRMLGAFNLSCMDRFGTAYLVCDDLVKHGHKILQFQARALRASCKRQYYLQNASPEIHGSGQLRYGSYKAGRMLRRFTQEIEFLLTVMHLTPKGLKAVHSASIAPWNIPNPDFDDACTYLETLIRFYATFQYLRIRRLNSLVLRLIDYWSHRVGYIVGAIHVEKYANRLDLVDLAATGGIFGRLNVMEELISAAIMRRDELLRGLAEQTLSNRSIANLLDKADEHIYLAGSSSLARGILQLRKASGQANGRYTSELKRIAPLLQIFDTTGFGLRVLRGHSELL